MHAAVTGDTGRYAIKLYDIASKDNSLDNIAKDLDHVRAHHPPTHSHHPYHVSQLAKALPDNKYLNYVSVPIAEKVKLLESEVYKAVKTSPLAKDFIGMLP